MHFPKPQNRTLIHVLPTITQSEIHLETDDELIENTEIEPSADEIIDDDTTQLQTYNTQEIELTSNV